ncbi:MAG: hypothetical protein ABWY02_15675 [Telluria sp.]
MEETLQTAVPPNPELIQDAGRLRLERLLETGKRELLDQPAVDTTTIPRPPIT